MSNQRKESRCVAGPGITSATLLVLAGACGDGGAVVDDEDGGSSSTTMSASSGDSQGSSSTGESPTFCAGATELRYDPLAGGIDAFPDDVLTESSDTPTGRRIRALHEGLPDDEPLAGFPSLFTGLASLDGFGNTAPMFVRVRGAIDRASLPAAGDEIDPTRASVLLVDLDADTPAFVAFDWRIVARDDGSETTLFVDPLVPLRSGGHYGLAVTRAVHDARGDCIAPSPTMQALLSGAPDDDRLAGAAETTAALVEVLREAGVIADPTELSAAIGFTTQTTIRQSNAIAEAIATSMPSPIAPAEACLAYAYQDFVLCEGSIRMVDFTDEHGIIAGTEPTRIYELPLVALLPLQGPGPYPTVVFGHGLTGDRYQGLEAAMLLAQDGYAVVAIDAPKHGDHPDASTFYETFDLLGLTNDAADPFSPLDARDNFRQATFDKLQLVHALEAGVDIDGDGDVDFMPDRLHYIGSSLGAVMAPHFLAYAPSVHAAVLVVGGAGLTDIVTSQEFAPLVAIVTKDFAADERARFLAISQAALDGGDPMLFAPAVLRARIDGFAGDRGGPQVLAQMAVGDTIVPNSSTARLARGLGLAIAGAEPVAMRGLEVLADFPVRANVAADQTAALVQFTDVVGSDGPEAASHYGVQTDPAARAQMRRFVLTSEGAGGAEVIDPALAGD